MTDASILFPDFVLRLAPQLQFFRFVKAPGGHMSDYDELVLVLQYSGESDLVSMLNDLGISCKRHVIQPPQPVSGKSYPAAEYSQFASLIPGTAWIEQPGWQEMAGVPLFIWCTTTTIKITLVGPEEKFREITSAEFRKARWLEVLFRQYAQRVIDPPVDVRNCFCPKYYPEYWQST